MNYQKDFQEVFSSEFKELDELLECLKKLDIEVPEQLKLVARTLIEKGDSAVAHYVAKLNRSGNSNIAQHVLFVRLRLSLMYKIAFATPQDFENVKAIELGFLNLKTELPGGIVKWKIPAAKSQNLIARLHSPNEETFNDAKKVILEYLVLSASKRSNNLFNARPKRSGRRKHLASES